MDTSVPIWEWCRVLDYVNPAGLPHEMWGVYNLLQNTEIEAGYQRHESRVPISIGIRSYNIIFDGPNYARQVDMTYDKVRHVRRRLVSAEEQSVRFNSACDVHDGDCVVCFTSFAETPQIPVVQLPGCGHNFHGACVQLLADTATLCPLCRADADWQSALAPCHEI